MKKFWRSNRVISGPTTNFLNLPTEHIVTLHPEVCEPRWRTSECNMCTRLGLGHNFRYKYYGRLLASLRTDNRTKIRKIGKKLSPNPNLLPMLRSDVRHLGSHTSDNKCMYASADHTIFMNNQLATNLYIIASTFRAICTGLVGPIFF